MKNIIFILLLVYSFTSCDSSGNKRETKTMKAEDMQMGPIRHDSLSVDQLERIKSIQATFAEVYPVSLEETITNFKRDLNPDKEIAIWMQMANAYRKFVTTSTPDSTKKKEAFELLLLRSMMPDDEAVKQARIKKLTDQEVNEILRYYGADPTPVTVTK